MNIYEQLFIEIEKAENIVITSHQSPDGDSVGSSVAIFEICKQFNSKKNKKILIFFPDKVPSNFSKILENTSYIIGDEDIEVAKNNILNADLLFSLDYNSHKRVGEKFENAIIDSKAFKIMIDHHLQPEEFSDLLISNTKSSSTCQLVYEICEVANHLDIVNSNVAKAIYLGLVTDTSSFRFNSVSPKTHQIASELLKKDIQHDKIHEEIIDTNTIEKLKMQSYIIHNNLTIISEKNLAYLFINKKEKELFNISKGDTEGLVNIALSIDGIKIAAFFSEEDEFVKISFRSKGKNNPVNILANKYFNGGGHANASGGRFIGSLEECIKLFLNVISEYV